MITADTAAWRLRQSRTENFMYVGGGLLYMVRRYWTWDRGLGVKVFGPPPFCLCSHGWCVPERYWPGCEEMLFDVGLALASRGSANVEWAYRWYVDRIRIYEVHRKKTRADAFPIVVAPDVLGDFHATLDRAHRFQRYMERLRRDHNARGLVVHQAPWDDEGWLDKFRLLTFGHVEHGAYDGVALPSRKAPHAGRLVECSRHVDYCARKIGTLLGTVNGAWIHLLGAPKKILESIKTQKHLSLISFLSNEKI